MRVGAIPMWVGAIAMFVGAIRVRAGAIPRHVGARVPSVRLQPDRDAVVQNCNIGWSGGKSALSDS
jgi:hypothetical protein